MRMNNKLVVSFVKDTCETEPICFKSVTDMMLHMPAAWTAASIGFKASLTKTGTYLPIYDGDVLVQFTPLVNQAFVVPVPQLQATAWLRLWSQDGTGTKTDQAAARSLSVQMVMEIR